MASQPGPQQLLLPYPTYGRLSSQQLKRPFTEKTRSCCFSPQSSPGFPSCLGKKFQVLALTRLIWPLATSWISFPVALTPHPPLCYSQFEILQTRQECSHFKDSALNDLSTSLPLPSPDGTWLASSFNFCLCHNVTFLERGLFL